MSYFKAAGEGIFAVVVKANELDRVKNFIHSPASALRIFLTNYGSSPIMKFSNI